MRVNLKVLGCILFLSLKAIFLYLSEGDLRTLQISGSSVLGKFWVCWDKWVISILDINWNTSQHKNYPRTLCTSAHYKHPGSSAYPHLKMPEKRHTWHSSSTSALVSLGSSWPHNAAANTGKAWIRKQSPKHPQRLHRMSRAASEVDSVWWDSSKVRYTNPYLTFLFENNYLVNYRRELGMN